MGGGADRYVGGAGRGALCRRRRRQRHVRAAGVLPLAARATRPAQLLSEFVATFGLLSVVVGMLALRFVAGAAVRRRRPTSPRPTGSRRRRRSPTRRSRSPARSPTRSPASARSTCRPSSSRSSSARPRRRRCSAGSSRACRRRVRRRGSPEPEASHGGRMMETVIFACVHNAGRSQMAAAFFNALADPSKRARRVCRHAARRARPPRGRRGHARGRASTCRGRGRRLLTDELATEARRCSSRWDAAKRARSFPASSASTGACPIRKVGPCMRSGRFATTFASGFATSCARDAGNDRPDEPRAGASLSAPTVNPHAA